jgi:hypothetical protein
MGICMVFHGNMVCYTISGNIDYYCCCCCRRFHINFVLYTHPSMI